MKLFSFAMFSLGMIQFSVSKSDLYHCLVLELALNIPYVFKKRTELYTQPLYKWINFQLCATFGLTCGIVPETRIEISLPTSTWGHLPEPYGVALLSGALAQHMSGLLLLCDLQSWNRWQCSMGCKGTLRHLEKSLGETNCQEVWREVWKKTLEIRSWVLQMLSSKSKFRGCG